MTVLGHSRPKGRAAQPANELTFSPLLGHAQERKLSRSQGESVIVINEWQGG